MPQNLTKPNHISLIYMYKKDLALNNLQWLICHKTQPIQIKPNQTIESKKQKKPKLLSLGFFCF